MAQLIVRNLDEELVTRLKLLPPNTAARPKPSIAKFCAKRLQLSRDDRLRSSPRKSVR
jgi:hypothetical protein